jgi:hypothetical protein
MAMQGGDHMSEFKTELMTLILKYFPEYEHITIKVSKPMATFSPKIEYEVME